LKFKIAIWIAMAFVTIYTIVYTVLIITQCHPISDFWNQYNLTWHQDHTAHCNGVEHQVRLAATVGALSVFSDWYSVMLPAALLFRIRVSYTQKFELLFIFGVGYW
jgi:hypothetical protein